MNYEEFKSSLNRIYNYFRAKEVPQYTIKLWFEEIKNIPAGLPLKEIESKIMNLDSLPRNMPKTYKAGWDLWLKANQDKVARLQEDSKTKCDYCGGSGLIFSKGVDHGMKYSFVSRCPRCRNWADVTHEAAIPSYDKYILEKNGFVVEGK